MCIRKWRIPLKEFDTSCTSGPPYTFSTVGYCLSGSKPLGLNSMAYRVSPDLSWCVRISGQWQSTSGTDLLRSNEGLFLIPLNIIF
jgi:hypothetical protein